MPCTFEPNYTKLENSHCGSVDHNVERFQSLCEKIALGGQTIKNAEKYFHLLHSLTTEWTNYINIITDTIPNAKGREAIIQKIQIKTEKGGNPDTAHCAPEKMDEGRKTEMAIKILTMQILKLNDLVSEKTSH
jgi:hypothetical protein